MIKPSFSINPGPTENYRVVQVHPLLKCNLRCAHCYSVSGPEQNRGLPLAALLPALPLLRDEGFNGLGVSGGEPLLYPHLPELLQAARALGFITTVTTNAMLLDGPRARLLKDSATLVAVSLDGLPESHNRIRGHPRAFEQMAAGVECLKAAKVPFGFIFTLTLFNLDELAWVVAYALDQGARLLQVHPLEEVGRAESALVGNAPDGLELARAYVELARLHEACGDRLDLQFDVADLAYLAAEPARGYAVELCPQTLANLSSYALASLLSPLVIEADGSVVPLQYNLSRQYQLGNLLAGDLKEKLSAWKTGKYPGFVRLCRNVFDRLTQSGNSEFPFANWYGEVLRESYRISPDASALAQIPLPASSAL